MSVSYDTLSRLQRDVHGLLHAVTVLVDERSQALELLRRWRSGLPSESLEDITDAFLNKGKS